MDTTTANQIQVPLLPQLQQAITSNHGSDAKEEQKAMEVKANSIAIVTAYIEQVKDCAMMDTMTNMNDLCVHVSLLSQIEKTRTIRRCTYRTVAVFDESFQFIVPCAKLSQPLLVQIRDADFFGGDDSIAELNFSLRALMYDESENDPFENFLDMKSAKIKMKAKCCVYSSVDEYYQKLSTVQNYDLCHSLSQSIREPHEKSEIKPINCHFYYEINGTYGKIKEKLRDGRKLYEGESSALYSSDKTIILYGLIHFDEAVLQTVAEIYPCSYDRDTKVENDTFSYCFDENEYSDDNIQDPNYVFENIILPLEENKLFTEKQIEKHGNNPRSVYIKQANDVKVAQNAKWLIVKSYVSPNKIDGNTFQIKNYINSYAVDDLITFEGEFINRIFTKIKNWIHGSKDVLLSIHNDDHAHGFNIQQLNDLPLIPQGIELIRDLKHFSNQYDTFYDKNTDFIYFLPVTIDDDDSKWTAFMNIKLSRYLKVIIRYFMLIDLLRGQDDEFNIFKSYYFLPQTTTIWNPKDHFSRSLRFPFAFLSVILSISMCSAMVYHVINIYEQDINLEETDTLIVIMSFLAFFALSLMTFKSIDSFIKFYQKSGELFDLPWFYIAADFITNVIISNIVCIISVFLLIASESYGDLVLNAFALTFIIEIDDMLNVFESDEDVLMQHDIDEFLSNSNQAKWKRKITYSWKQAAFILIVPFTAVVNIYRAIYSFYEFFVKKTQKKVKKV